MKKSIRRLVHEMSPYDLDTNILDAIKRLQEIEKEYGPTARLNWHPDRWFQYDSSPSPTYEVFVEGIETDEEYNKRVLLEDKQAAEKLSRELAEFDRLSKLFGKK